MAIYRVTLVGTNQVRLIEAPTNSAALRHVCADSFDVAVCKPRDVADIMALDVQLEEYGKDGQGALPLAEPCLADPAGEVLQEAEQ